MTLTTIHESSQTYICLCLYYDDDYDNNNYYYDDFQSVLMKVCQRLRLVNRAITIVCTTTTHTNTHTCHAKCKMHSK